MKSVLVLGDGCREQALVEALRKTTRVVLRNDVPEDSLQQYDLVVPGSETYLEDGIADKCSRLGVPCFGPTKAAAQLETSKAFAKTFMRREGIPTANYQIVERPQDFVRSDWSVPFVIKQSGVAGGKGVHIVDCDHQDIVLDDDKTYVVEEYIQPGQEVSHMYFCDGRIAVPMPPSQDHKRRFEGDTGPMTGGMGAVAPCPHADSHVDTYAQKVLDRLRLQKMPYVGVLYIGVMVTPSGPPKVLEFNCRFGDPEAQAVLPMLHGNLYNILMACVKGTLRAEQVRWRDNTCSAALTLCTHEYPLPSEPVDVNFSKDILATTKRQGRIATVVQTAQTIRQAVQSAVSRASTYELSFRRDIGHHSIPLRIGVLGSTRGTDLKGIMEAIESKRLYATVEIVVSNIPTAGILNCGAKAQYLSPQGLRRDQYDRIVTTVLEEHNVDVVVLIGYMRILGNSFCRRWTGRCFNVHPSLLPKYSGYMDKRIHASVLSNGETESGCTIHEVVANVDEGRIVVQKKCPVHMDDSVHTLKERVQRLEVESFIDLFRMVKSSSYLKV